MPLASSGDTLGTVPTILPRTNITHTKAIQEALTIAAEHWPDQKASNTALLTKLATKAATDLRREQQNNTERLERIAERANNLYGHSYPDNYLADIRAGWPE